MLHQLLDPAELVKHNKQLKSFVAVGKDLKTTNDHTAPAQKLAKDTKSVKIPSLQTTAKEMRKTKSARSMKTSTGIFLKTRKLRRKKIQQVQYFHNVFVKQYILRR